MCCRCSQDAKTQHLSTSHYQTQSINGSHHTLLVNPTAEISCRVTMFYHSTLSLSLSLTLSLLSTLATIDTHTERRL
ncbi:hypothetical protein RIF29_17094 [Crotalaria pallida]|uniref:Uncharacterized protein n=1 Tax=Crotalaria pallida TaxID=3830 RepID=A0AAN9IK91_CROPI